MKKVILTKEGYDTIKKAMVNELTYGKIKGAEDRSEDLFDDVRFAVEELDTLLQDVRYKVEYSSKDGEQKKNPYLEKLQALTDEMFDILKRKKNQSDMFRNERDKVDSRAYYDRYSNEEDYPEIEDVDMGWLKSNYPNKQR